VVLVRRHPSALEDTDPSGLTSSPDPHVWIVSLEGERDAVLQILLQQMLGSGSPHVGCQYDVREPQLKLSPGSALLIQENER
jgi:hypothetical protein